VVAKKAAAQTSERRAFYRQLAESLANPDERAAFLRSSGYSE